MEQLAHRLQSGGARGIHAGPAEQGGVGQPGLRAAAAMEIGSKMQPLHGLQY